MVARVVVDVVVVDESDNNGCVVCVEDVRRRRRREKQMEGGQVQAVVSERGARLGECGARCVWRRLVAFRLYPTNKVHGRAVICLS